MGGRGSSSGYGWQTQLRQAAKSGKMPTWIAGSPDMRAQVFEMIDKLYPMPSQANVYRIDELGTEVRLTMRDGRTQRAVYPSGSAASAAEKNGVLKWALANS